MQHTVKVAPVKEFVPTTLAQHTVKVARVKEFVLARFAQHTVKAARVKEFVGAPSCDLTNSILLCCLEV